MGAPMFRKDNEPLKEALLKEKKLVTAVLRASNIVKQLALRDASRVRIANKDLNWLMACLFTVPDDEIILFANLMSDDYIERYNLSDSKIEVEKQFNAMTSGNREEACQLAQSAMTESALAEYTLRESAFEEMNDVLSVFVKCGARLSLQKFFGPLSEGLKADLLTKYGAEMLAEAALLGKKDTVDYLLNIGTNVNDRHFATELTLSQYYVMFRTPLAYALIGAISAVTLSSKEMMGKGNCDDLDLVLPLEEVAAIAKLDVTKEIINALLKKGADSDLVGLHQDGNSEIKTEKSAYSARAMAKDFAKELKALDCISTELKGKAQDVLDVVLRAPGIEQDHVEKRNGFSV